MRILILGSEGQIGKSVCDFLKEKHIDTIEWDIEKDPSHDLRVNKNGLLNILNQCDFVYYFASDVGGAKYLEKNQNNFNFIKNNIDIMSLTFSCLKESKKPFIFTSSQMAELSHSTYGLLKMIGEKMCEDIGGLVVRLWNVYGYEKNEEKAHVITDFIKMAKFKNSIQMRTDGEESRQFLFAEDCAECLLNLTNQYNKLDKKQNYHITSFEWVKIKDIAAIISSITDCKIIRGDKKDQTQMNAMNLPDPYVLNFWKPKTSLIEGISSIYNKI